jgi:hypothetical protein
LFLLDALARRYSCRPSEILRGGLIDFHIDLAACLEGVEAGKQVDQEANVVEW